MFNWSEFQKLQINCMKFNSSFRIQVQVYIHNWTYRVQRRVFNFSWQNETWRTKLVKNNYAAIPNILQQQKINETSVHRSDTDAVTTTETPPVRVKRVGRGGGARCPCFFLVALPRENDSSHFSLLLLKNNTVFPIFWKKSA